MAYLEFMFYGRLSIPLDLSYPYDKGLLIQRQQASALTISMTDE